MPADPKNPEVVAKVRNEIEAAAIVTALAAEGIEATTTGEYTSGFRAEAPGQVSVVVRNADLVRAEQILAEFKEHEPDIDWSNVDVGDGEST